MDERLILRSISVRHWVLGALALSTLVCANPLHAAETKILPVPAITIYPGDTIKDNWLVDREFSSSVVAARSSLVDSRAMLVGKTARRTLLPGAPIPWNAVADPKLVINGAKVRIVFEEDGLSITTYGAALQSGGGRRTHFRPQSG